MYQQDAAEKNAHLTATALELLLETNLRSAELDEPAARRLIQAFNIILSQQILQEHMDDVCILIDRGQDIVAVDDGHVLYDFLFRMVEPPAGASTLHTDAIRLYRSVHDRVQNEEQIVTVLEGHQTFHVLVPLVPRGDKIGVVYMKTTPEFSFISTSILGNFTQTSAVFLGLMLVGLLAMFYISSYSLRQRDLAQQELFTEQERQISERVHFQKEALFAKRIYHTHHKAEKVMGFIKEDLHQLEVSNIDETKYRMSKYANFIARVIYDMKWFDPPLQTIRNPLFRTDLNEVIRFIIQNLFLRITHNHASLRFETDLAEALPRVPVNEFVIWEILEPLLQNSIEHGGNENLGVRVTSAWQATPSSIQVTISDSGDGIPAELLQSAPEGVQRIFLENTSTKINGQNSGYGCYIAYEMATRCGWQLQAENIEPKGCRFIITIPCESKTAADSNV
jgi:signal transduction histidine kinase